MTGAEGLGPLACAGIWRGLRGRHPDRMPAIFAPEDRETWLTGDPEAAAAKQTVFDLQITPKHPGPSFHRVDRARDKDFRTVRDNSDIRLVVHRRIADMLLAFVGHHDDACHWADPFAHPDAQRRFRLMVDEEALRRALDAPWEKWTVFLRRARREFVTRDFIGPARVTGSAGAGWTSIPVPERSGSPARTPRSGCCSPPSTSCWPPICA